jgi:hypothetical protein
MRKSLRRIWNAYRHVAAFRGLLQWTGWWETAIAVIVSAVGAAGSFLRGLPWPITVTIAIVLASAISICWRVWASTRGLPLDPDCDNQPPARSLDHLVNEIIGEIQKLEQQRERRITIGELLESMQSRKFGPIHRVTVIPYLITMRGDGILGWECYMSSPQDEDTLELNQEWEKRGK